MKVSDCKLQVRGFVASGLIATFLACSSSRPELPNILIVLVDTLRADHVDTGGGDRSPTPFLDSLADRSFVFQNAYSQSSWTSPSVASLFTSRYPSQHGIWTFQSVLAKDELTLAEALGSRGYRTGGFSANWLIRQRLGFGQGFDLFEAMRGTGEALRQKPERGENTVARAFRWIDRAEDESTPFFVYVQLMDPHTPYHPPEHAVEWAFAGRSPPDVAAINEALFQRAENALSDSQRETAEHLYRAEVRSTDEAIRGLMEALEDRDLMDDTLVAVLSDHGEEFWDHGSMGHSSTLYDEQIRVPLIIHMPGQVRRVDVTRPVSLVDMAPTLLEWIADVHPPTFEGRSFADVLSSGADADPRTTWDPLPVISELIVTRIGRQMSPHERAIMLGDYKLIAGIHGELEFYDRADDPREHGEGKLPSEASEKLEQALRAFVEHIPREERAETAPLDEETRLELEALGYAH